MEAGGTYEEMEERAATDFPAKIALIRSMVGEGRVRLLDVGCGKGYFVRACRNAGMDASGIDISQTAVEAACNDVRVPATCAGIEEAAPRLGRFDAVTLWATIEHLADPSGTLAAIRSVLSANGWLFLDTGAGHDLLERLLPGVTQWYDPPQHLFVFSARGMSRLLTDAGFSVVSIDRCFERSSLRRVIRLSRALGAAATLRAVSTAFRLTPAEFAFTRWPLGNLMSVVCRAG
jgi:SAM-dependent methyltransferase